MASFFFGSSNVYRNYTKAVESGLFSGRNLQLVQCTKKAEQEHLYTALMMRKRASQQWILSYAADSTIQSASSSLIRLKYVTIHKRPYVKEKRCTFFVLEKNLKFCWKNVKQTFIFYRWLLLLS